MNIFYVDTCPTKAAQAMCNSHVVKMILESAQLLCGVHHWYAESQPWMYRETHINHPSAKWARSSWCHYDWLHQHAMALCSEYTYRYGRVHKSQELIERLAAAPLRLQVKPHTWADPPQAMPDAFKHTNTITAYRMYYTHGKHHLHKWTRRPPQSWIKEHEAS